MKIISVSGVDGSGKTTVSKFIRKFLSSRGFSVKIVHPNKGIPGFKDFDKGNSKGNMKLLSFFVIIKDMIMIYYFCLRYLFCDYLIFDRYIGDTLVKVKYRYNMSFRLERLFPRPLASFFLDVDHGKSFSRDKDHGTEFHKRKTSIYRKYFNRIGKVFVVDSNKKIEKVCDKVKIILEKLN